MRFAPTHTDPREYEANPCSVFLLSTCRSRPCPKRRSARCPAEPDRRSPEAVRTARCREIPAIPTTSPARTSILTPSRTGFPFVPRIETSDTASTFSPGVTGLRSTPMGSRPTMRQEAHGHRYSLLHYACHGAVTEHRDAIGHIKDLVQLMADQNKALSLFGELFNGIQKLLNLKRRQHACWLINIMISAP